MDYPTRERAETIRDCNAQCKRCSLHNTPDTQHCVFVTDKTDTMNLNEQIGISYLAFHDALDTKQVELDGRTKALDWTAARCDGLALEAGLTKIELDKAHDLIRRMSGTLMEWDKWDNSGLIGEAKEMLEVS